MTPMLRADLHVHTLPFEGQRHAAVSRQPRLLLAAGGCVPRRRRRAAWIWSRSPITIRSTARSSCSNDRPDAADVIVGEEVSCWLPDGGIEVHLGVYGMTEALHRDLQPLRGNVFDVAARLRERGRVLRAEPPAAFLSRPDAARALPAAARRGARRSRSATARCWPRTTRSSSGSRGRSGGRRRRADASRMVAGSDAHTLRRVGTTWTDAPGPHARRVPRRACAAGLGVAGRRARHRRDRSRATPTASSRAYIAALAGFGPRDLSRLAPRRLSGVRRRCRCRFSSCRS